MSEDTGHGALAPSLEQALGQAFRPHLESLCVRTSLALAATGFSSLLVHSGSLLDMFQDDQPYPYQPHAPFKVWIPAAEVPDSFVFFEPGSRPLLLFHNPIDYWHKRAALPHSWWTDAFDIRPIADRAGARHALPARLDTTAYIGDSFDGLAGWGLAAVNPQTLIRQLDFSRAVKSPYELLCMREANRLGALGHRASAQAFMAGASEFEIELAFLRACGQREQELPYNPIIAFNESASVLHYQMLERVPPAQRHSMLMDAGAEFAGYASDITRTYSFRDRDFANLVQRMDEMQLALCNAVRPGADWRDIHLLAHEKLATVLREADITSVSDEESVSKGVTSVFLPHGIGHLLGLQAHDVGGFMKSIDGGEIERPAAHPFLRLTRVLQPGFVVTMEPGLYFIDSLLQAAQADPRGDCINWTRVRSLRRFGGIRIEDNLAVTSNGCDNLTRQAFASLTA